MTSVMSVNDVKKGYSGKQKVPREGSSIRIIYDVARTGEWFSPVALGFKPTSTKNTITNLTEMYGQEFEIRKAPNIYAKDPKRPGKHIHEFRLKGEWEGQYFSTLDQILGRKQNE